ncbi:hypothetical protein PTTG_27978 [Puccinia triticina 1-1 BBBD Race 1]|uniref:MutS protein homolog 3 n=1 Tax=Puccinia triticina (isolate 1-1 / race 1 (BBBD)) TaxID=630390 RepID=A0A180GHG2_PUCT1|nr:hypothetical protein PTTG_27978 [Puccinia triticina 1-1 BBBD Race 1]
MQDQSRRGGRQEQGRDPIVEKIINNTLVPNKCEFTPNSLLMMILTGHNWGGKLVTTKMSGCIVLLAQMGSFVPAKRATVGLFDGCYTRMGMSEELAQGQSAFMVKIINAAKILWMAIPRPLVIIDELSYGSKRVQIYPTKFLEDKLGAKTED